MGGAHFREDTDFVAAAIRDVALLQRHAGLTRESRLLDWGCGAGRLAVGIRQSLGHVRDYHGVDIQPDAAHLGAGPPDRRAHPLHPRRRRATSATTPTARPTYDIPAEPGSVDVLYAYSVFSHMLERRRARLRRAPSPRSWRRTAGR